MTNETNASLQVVPTSLTVETTAYSSTSKRGRACNSVQGAAAAMGLTATAATWNLNLQNLVNPEGSNPTLSAIPVRSRSGNSWGGAQLKIAWDGVADTMRWP